VAVIRENSELVVQKAETTNGGGIVYARALKGFMDLAAALGANPERIARNAGLDIGLLRVPDALLPVATYYRLHEQILAQTGNMDFGLLSGRVSYMENAHLFLYLASASQTLRDWLNMLPSVSSLLGDVGSIRIARHRDHFALEWHPVQTPDPVRCVVTDGLLSATALEMDGYCLLPVRPQRVDFTYPRPNDLTVLQDTFRVPLYFDQPVSALYYDWKLLDNPQLHVSTRFHDDAVEEFSAYFSDNASAADPFSLNLHTAIRRQLPAGSCSIDSIASDLNVSRRTLQRRLKERGNNFQQLLQRVKSDLAEKYLEDKSLSIIEIALLLGYGDPSSFSAAFKSWKGITPSEYRRQ
jgi:AraC-like DNA-binding protein